METLKKEWKKLIASDIEAVFKEMEAALLPDSPHFNDLSLLKITYQDNSQKLRLTLIKIDDANLVFNQVNYALLKLIDELTEEDLQPSFRKKNVVDSSEKIALQDHHKYTCDRVEQSDFFQQTIIANRGIKLYFHSILGIDLQSHEGIFKRFAYGMEGRLLDFLNPNLKTECESLKVSLTFDASNDLIIYKQNILKSLFTALSLPPAEHQPILEKNLSYLLDKSPQMTALGKEDFVCVFLNISQWDWNAKITPVVTRWFITEFCQGNLPESCPTFHFFFGIVMDEDDEEMQAEIREAIEKSEFISKLPELGMVKRNDLSKWFAKYKFIINGARERKEKVKAIFDTDNEKYMEDVELDLERIIHEYNNRLL